MAVGFLEQVVVGNILGDAWIERKSSTSNARLRYSQASPLHDGCFFYTYIFYALFCPSNSTFRERTDSRTGTTSGSNYFSTRAIPFFTAFYNKFYVDGRKIVPVNIANFLTPVAVAFWIMDDGGYAHGGLALHTQGFTQQEVDLLVNALNQNFNINSYKLQDSRGKPYIYIKKREVPLLAAQVARYMHPSMYYKLGIGSRSLPTSKGVVGLNKLQEIN